MAMIEVKTLPCLGCGDAATFTMDEEQFNRWQGGEHPQRVLPDWSPEDRERLISGTCPTCWEEMWAEDEEEDELTEDEYDFLFPESDDPTYERDWYVD